MWLLKWLASLLGVPTVLGLACWWGFHHIEAMGEAKSAAALAASNQSVITALVAAKTEHAVVQQLLEESARRKAVGNRALTKLAPQQRADHADADRLNASSDVNRSADAPCVISDALALTKGL